MNLALEGGYQFARNNIEQNLYSANLRNANADSETIRGAEIAVNYTRKKSQLNFMAFIIPLKC